MTTSLDDLEKVLTQLDSGNDEHWTDDGAPSLEAVQKIGNDTTITREQINKAIPGFSRAGSSGEEPADEVEAVDDPRAAGQKTVVAPRDKGAPAPKDEGDLLSHADTYVLDPKDPLSDVPLLSRDRVKEIMQRRVENAQNRLDQARAGVTAAQDFVHRAEIFHAQALAAYTREFPPMHPIDAIKAHLRSQMEHAAAMAGKPDLYARPVAASPLDARMGIKGERKVRGLNS